MFRSVLELIIYLEMVGEHPGSKLQDICQKNKLELRNVKGMVNELHKSSVFALMYVVLSIGFGLTSRVEIEIIFS